MMYALNQLRLPRFLSWGLARMAQATLWRFRPGIVGISGSTGKTTTKSAVRAVLEGDRSVRVSYDGITDASSILLAILGGATELEARQFCDPEQHARAGAYNWFWFKVLFRSMWQFARLPKNKYPEFLLLEYGAREPGAIRSLLEIVRPNAAVLTNVGDIPSHMGHYPAVDDAVREYMRLIEQLPAAGFAILNGDDEALMRLKHRTRAHVMTFGSAKDSHVHIMGIEQKVDGTSSVGLACKLEYGGSTVPMRLEGALGHQHAYAAAAAASVGIIFGMNLVSIAGKLAAYVPPAGTMRLIPGVKSTRILDDAAAEASPLSVKFALDLLESLPGKRRIFVLGDLIDLGKYAVEAHEQIGILAKGKADIFMTIGSRAKIAAEAALKARMNKKNVLSFDRAEDAGIPLQTLLKKDDVVLVMGSRAMRLDRVVKEIKVPDAADIMEAQAAPAYIPTP
jgi:UDP-N-acetylmuramyl pentapeptide synthase